MFATKKDQSCDFHRTIVLPGTDENFLLISYMNSSPEPSRLYLHNDLPNALTSN
ncbi:hypothetical protein B0T12DRAFT_424049 [Alternaria alternata]|nr:hypothetical protein B0T12DRAFT_424049 [Alternaria alternata]